MALDSFKSDSSVADSNDDSDSGEGYNHTYDRDKKYKDSEWLRERIQSQGMSQQDIADMCGVSRSTIQYYVGKFSIDPSESNKKNKSINLSEHDIHIIEGELLGDASLHKPGNVGNAKFQASDKNESFIDWLYSILPDEMFTDNYKYEVNNGSYMLVSRNIVELTDIHSRWYDGAKQVYQDFEINSTNLLHWYMGDGTLPEESGPNISVKWAGVDGVNYLASEIRENVCSCNVYRYEKRNESYWRISIPKASEKSFFEYIGQCPVQCYEYKWR